MQALETWLDSIVPEGLLLVCWTEADGSPNTDLYTHDEFCATLRGGAWQQRTNVRFEVVPGEDLPQPPALEDCVAPATNSSSSSCVTI